MQLKRAALARHEGVAAIAAAAAATTGTVLDRRLLALIDAALAAGDLVAARYGRSTAALKTDGSHITRADLAADRVIRTRLAASGVFDDASFVDEESGTTDGSGDDCLIIDPIDGTTNFVLMVPFFAVSIGVFRGGEPELGVVYNPIVKELFFGCRGGGSYVVDLARRTRRLEIARLVVARPMRRAREEQLQRGVHAFCHGGNPRALERMIRVYEHMKRNNPKYRQFGSASLEMCMLAKGQITSFNMTGVNLWDVAAGCVIAREAGARLSDFEGNSFGTSSENLLACESSMHHMLLAFIREALAA